MREGYYLSVLGKPTLYSNGVEIPLTSRKFLALITYLSTRDPLSESRENLAGLLWGDSSEENARMSLRQTLSKFREAKTRAIFESNRLDVWLSAGVLRCDHTEVVERLQAGILDDRLLSRSRLPASFLEGYEDIDSGFRSWLMVYRQGYEDRLMRLLESHLRNAKGPDDRRMFATAILKIEPSHEPANRAAMEAFAEVGDPSGALRIYKSLWNLLANDYDTEPSLETQVVVANIKRGELKDLNTEGKPDNNITASQSVENVARVKRLGHSLYVKSFSVEEASVEHRSLARIFRAELIATLTRFRDWRVLEFDPGPDVVIEQSHLIEASVFSDADSPRFVLTFRDLSNGKFVWSERFALDSQAWFENMRNMIRRIAVALEVNISTDRLERTAGSPDLSLELFDRWLRGQRSIFLWQPEEEAVAEKLYLSIIAEEPQFAPAYAGMAGILNARHLIFPGLQRNKDTQREALDYATRAVELDPLDSRTQLHFAWSLAMNAEFQRAARSFQLAIELNSDDPWTLVSAAEGLALSGNLRESLELVSLAHQVGLQFSSLQWSYQSVVWFATGHYENCATAAKQAGYELNCCGGWAAAALALLGKKEEANRVAAIYIERVKRKWAADTPPTETAVVNWMVMSFPMALENTRSNLVKGLEISGFPPQLGTSRQHLLAHDEHVQ